MHFPPLCTGGRDPLSVLAASVVAPPRSTACATRIGSECDGLLRPQLKTERKSNMLENKVVDPLCGSVPVPEGRLVDHSTRRRGIWHWYEDHARGTGELARLFAECWGGGELAYRLG